MKMDELDKILEECRIDLDNRDKEEKLVSLDEVRRAIMRKHPHFNEHRFFLKRHLRKMREKENVSSKSVR